MPVEEQRAGVPELEGECRVDDVGRCQPVVEPAALLVELRLDGVDEGGQVVAGLALQLGDPLGGGRNGAGANCPRCLARDDAELGPRVDGGELDLEPGGELPLVRPDLGHGGTGVARDHCSR